MTNYPCVSIEVGNLVYKTLYWVTSWITEFQWKKLLRRRSVFFAIVSLWSKSKLFSPVSFYFQLVVLFYNSASFQFLSCPMRSSGDDIFLPDPAFLEIIGSGISRTSLAPSTTRTVLCRALWVLFHPGIPQAWPRHLLAFCCQSRSVQQRWSFLWRNKEFLVVDYGCEIRILSAGHVICLP